MGHISSLNRQGGRRYPQLHGISVCGWLPGYGTTVTVVVADVAPIYIDGLAISIAITANFDLTPDISIASLQISPTGTWIGM